MYTPSHAHRGLGEAPPWRPRHLASSTHTGSRRHGDGSQAPRVPESHGQTHTCWAPPSLWSAHTGRLHHDLSYTRGNQGLEGGGGWPQAAKPGPSSGPAAPCPGPLPLQPSRPLPAPAALLPWEHPDVRRGPVGSFPGPPSTSPTPLLPKCSGTGDVSPEVRPCGCPSELFLPGEASAPATACAGRGSSHTGPQPFSWSPSASGDRVPEAGHGVLLAE